MNDITRDALQKRQAFSFLKALRNVFPSVSLDSLLEDAFELSQHENAEHYMSLLENAKKQTIDKQTEKNLKAIYEQGYDIKHTLLYLAAPTESPLNDKTTKDEYLHLWNSEGQFKPRVSKAEILERSLMATKGLLVLLGATTIVPGILVGISINDPLVVETGKILATETMGVINDFGEAFNQPSVSNVAQNTLEILGLGLAGAAFKSKLKKAQTIDLRSKIRDGARTDEKKDILLEKLNALSKASQHLISHFSPEETCLFLVSDPGTQEKMWKRRPPSFEQRALSNLVDGKERLLERMWQQVKLAGSSWDGENGLSGPVTLRDSLLKLREKAGATGVDGGVLPRAPSL